MPLAGQDILSYSSTTTIDSGNRARWSKRASRSRRSLRLALARDVIRAEDDLVRGAVRAGVDGVDSGETPKRRRARARRRVERARDHAPSRPSASRGGDERASGWASLEGEVEECRVARPVVVVDGVVQRLREELVEVRLADARGTVQGRDEGFGRVRILHVVAHGVRQKVRGGVLAVQVRSEVRAHGWHARGAQYVPSTPHGRRV